jgi:hypothetical protein
VIRIPKIKMWKPALKPVVISIGEAWSMTENDKFILMSGAGTF